MITSPHQEVLTLNIWNVQNEVEILNSAYLSLLIFRRI